MNSEFDRPRCPDCGRFVADAWALANGDGLIKVTGVCRKHGTVTLGTSWWVYELWFIEESA